MATQIQMVRKRYATQLKTLSDRKANLRKQILLINKQICNMKERRAAEVERLRSKT